MITLPPCGAARSVRPARRGGLSTVITLRADPVAAPSSSFPAPAAAYLTLLLILLAVMAPTASNRTGSCREPRLGGSPPPFSMMPPHLFYEASSSVTMPCHPSFLCSSSFFLLIK